MYTLVNEFGRSCSDRARSVQIQPKTPRVEIIASELTHGEGGNLALLHFTSLPLRVRTNKFKTLNPRIPTRTNDVQMAYMPRTLIRLATPPNTYKQDLCDHLRDLCDL